MSLRLAILIMSAFGVVSDSILIAFYPQFFGIRYGITSEVHVGAYIAAISVAVMCMLPVWARIARHFETLHLLVYTQFIAALFCIAAIWAPTVHVYWLLTMLMFMVKASYLLMFPYLMRMEAPRDHAMLIGMLSVVVHVGAILGAAAGGWVLQEYGASASILLMASGDLLQMALCIYLIRTGKALNVLEYKAMTQAMPIAKRSSQAFMALLQLSILMLLFDFAAYLIRPFFTMHWEAVTGIQQQSLTGFVFAIPGIVALAALAIKHFFQPLPWYLEHTLINLLVGVLGLGLQAASFMWIIVLGRVLYGWAIYQVIIKLEVSLFKISAPEAYARDFAITNFFQNLGVLLSSFAAGYIVSWIGIPMTFIIAAAAMLLTAVIDRYTFSIDSRNADNGVLPHGS